MNCGSKLRILMECVTNRKPSEKGVMAARRADKNKKSKFLNADEAEELFSRVDETGHDNEDTARRERARRKEKGVGVDVDPLSDADPSGSTVERAIKRTAILFVVLTLLVVTLAQVSCGIVRRTSTASLTDEVTVENVSAAMKNGIEWGGGFTQFPDDFTIIEASESTGRLEVSVTDSTSENARDCFSSAQVQSTALAINALLNPDIDVVVYHVNVHADNDGNFQTSQLFGFLRPAGDVRSFMTFIWTKNSNEDGVWFSCSITGMDEETTAELRDQLKSNIVTDLLVPDQNEEKTSEEESGALTPSDKQNESDDTTDNQAVDGAADNNDQTQTTEQ